MNLESVEVLGLDGEFVATRRLVVADHFVEFGDHRLDKIQHEVALFDHLVLLVRDLFLREPDVVEQAEWQVLDLRDPGVDVVLFIAGLKISELLVEGVSIRELKAASHNLSSWWYVVRWRAFGSALR